ncbi:hypothetical protein FRB94_001150 [Tulasnella sp. JGI-2019a]|nr:hypothetical protein FRB93_000891 [Tulasnella sp. JGI-2019a]KAG9005875.1 hypothetical protein FRB94_001150 [Tulasnella sp. JGI-2019a]
MSYSKKVCNGGSCMPGGSLQPDDDIGIATNEFAKAHRLPSPSGFVTRGSRAPPYSGTLSVPSHYHCSNAQEVEVLAAVARKVGVLTSIQSRQGCWNYNPAAIHDLRLILKDNEMKSDLSKSINIFFFITDIPDIYNLLGEHLHGARATVRILSPTRWHMEFSVRYATDILRPANECFMWFGCASRGNNALELVDSSVRITGSELYRWLVEYTDPRVSIRVILDVSQVASI